ncbi:MAG: PAS domain-containing sensor histidine kinase [Alphaproteobacteria bacterium]|nr:PAS domain-containing sensor histidine kinase [Alphaproteobacteria bacterium]
MNSAAGNDNYKPGLKPPDPIHPSYGGWLSSNMAQLMVFLNGVILTLTAFATLSIFIDELIKENLSRASREVQEHIVSGYRDAEQSLQAVAVIAGTLEPSQKQQLGHFIDAGDSRKGYFKNIYWLYEDPAQSGASNWGLSVFKESEEKDILSFDTPKDKKDFIDFILLQGSGRSLSNFMIPNVPQAQTKRDYAPPLVHDRIFALVLKVKGGGYIVGITSVNYFINLEWFEQRSFIREIDVVDTQGDLPLYTLQMGKGNMPAQHTHTLSEQLSGRTIEIRTGLNVGGREAFLQKIPFLMLLFGITLTLIGTLYVRNNQSQSRKLADMNKELAHKNFELNQEMSERERLNNVIQKSAEENRSIINSVSDVIFETTIDGTIVFLNETWKKVTGFELERSIGRNLFDLIYVQDQEEQRYNFEEFVAGHKQSYRAFTRLRSSDGFFRAIELTISMLRQDESKDLRVVGTITDVEDRRRAERALSEAEKKYRAIVENAAGGIYQVTPEGQFLSANPALAKILGFDAPEEVLRDITKAQDQLYVDTVRRERFLSDIQALDVSHSFEGRIRKKDGSQIWVNENVRPVKDDEGNLLYFEGSMEDIDQRKKAEIALTEAKIESDLANKSKSEFLANMSHELRTPLNSIIGFSEIIKNEAFGQLPQKEYKDYASDIYKSGKNLLNVINEILDVSRIEAGERTLNEGLVNVKKVIADCLGLVEGKIRSTNTRIENKTLGSDLSFVGEEHAVKQMVLNLMSNAMKFSPEGSMVMLDAELDSKGRLRLSVTDTGVGLSENEIEKALSPFGQLDTELNRSKSGTGLGLTLVKTLIGLHGGELELVSQKGIGTTATLIFPAKRVAASLKTTYEEQIKQQEEQDSPSEEV